MTEWSDIQHLDSYQAFERFRREPSIDNFNAWSEAAHNDISMKGYAFTGFTRQDGTECSLETIMQKLQQ